MKNYFERSARKMNTVTVIFILAFFILAIFYCGYKFSKYWEFQNPISIRPLFKRVYLYENYLKIEPLKPTPTISPTPTPKKSTKPQGSPKNAPILKSSGSMSTDQTIADYISSKDWDYSVAIRLAKSENFYNFNKHFDCNRTNVNKDGSIDRGIFMINSVHDSQISPEDAFNCFKNIDFAYNLYKRSGWSPWVAYTTGRYLAHSEDIN